MLETKWTIARVIRFAALIYLCWLGMMAVHESGHIIHARLAGGTVSYVSFPLIGFSQTHLTYNPAPAFIAGGGFVWGSLIPLLFLLPCYFLHPQLYRLMQFFTGFCLIANGLYLAVGWTMTAGDGHDLYRLSVPAWGMVLTGTMLFSIGLYFWHRLGRKLDTSIPK
jgi:hypothetical protein